jgi:glycosyltransferase involved in cell wall biosynthesis
MRIGVDMLALQSPGSRARGVGRFGRNLVEAMLGRDDGHEYVFYAHDGLPIDLIPESPRATLSLLRPEPTLGESRLREAMERLARTNPHGLDLLLLINPFELVPGYEPPARPLDGLKVATVVHDLIPFLFQEEYLYDPPNAAWNYRRLRALVHYDALLTNSDATRADCLRMLGLPEGRVVTVGGAADGSYFRPDRTLPLPAATRATLHRLGVLRPFVFCLAGPDPRKNLRGLIDAFRLLPPPVRRRHQLVVTCFLKEADARKVRRSAEERGLAESLVLTGEVPDATLRVLYQRCSAFAFPSRYEGLGLPLLEAMHCGAAVVAGNNSSQVEVVGDAGLLANVDDAGDVAAKLARVLEDAGLAEELGTRAIERAGRFTWERSAERALEALERVVAPRRGRRARPRVAFVSPWSPKGTGIANYAEQLIDALARHYRIDLYHDAGYVPELGLRPGEFSCHDYRLFRRRAAVLGYRGVVYQMGNSFYHGFLFDMMRRFPGVVTLHDFSLAAFHYTRAHLRGGVAIDNFLEEVGHSYPDRVGEIARNVGEWSRERGGLQEAFARRGLHLNRRVFEWAEAVVVHSPWCREQARAVDPAFADKAVVIPHGASPRLVAPERRAATRARFGLPPGALIFGCFGILAQGKMNVEAIEAFRLIARERPEVLLVFVGQDWENGEARDKVAALGLEGRVRFLGRQGDAEFADLIAAADVGICLRRPPTYGETSGALLHLLRHGVPTVITDVATFADYPDAVVRKVRWPDDGLDGLARAFAELADDPPRRAALGRAGREYVARYHSWSRAAALYAEVIERVFEGARMAAAGRPRQAVAC